jgi:hypothetical protein
MKAYNTLLRKLRRAVNVRIDTNIVRKIRVIVTLSIFICLGANSGGGLLRTPQKTFWFHEAEGMY